MDSPSARTTSSPSRFVFLCEDMRHADDVELLADRVTMAFNDPFRLARSGSPSG